MSAQSLASALSVVASAIEQAREREPVDTKSLNAALETLKAWRTISGASEAIFFLAWFLPPFLLVLALEWSEMGDFATFVAGIGGIAMIPWGLLIRTIIDRILENAGATRQQIADANSLLRVAPIYLNEKMQ